MAERANSWCLLLQNMNESYLKELKSNITETLHILTIIKEYVRVSFSTHPVLV